MGIKVMNYNIMHGFHTMKKPFRFEKERLRKAKKVIEAEDPDILIMTEAGFGHNNKYGIKMDYSKIFGFPFVYHAPANIEWGSALFSKHPIIDPKNLSGDWISYLRGLVKTPDGNVDVNVFHPYPKITEAEKIRFLKRKLSGNPKNLILAGDFNALSHRDIYDREKMLRGFRSFSKDPEGAVKRFLQRSLHPHLEDRGLVDTYRQKRPKPNRKDYTIPTDFLSENKDSAMRLDHIYCSPDFNVKDAYIIQNKLSDQASDHYPTVSVLDFKK